MPRSARADDRSCTALRYGREVGWEYTSVQVDAWMPLSVQGGPKQQLESWARTAGRHSGDPTHTGDR